MEFLSSFPRNKIQMRLNIMPGSRLYWLSSSDVYQEFIQGSGDDFIINAGSNVTREVNIEWVRPLARGLWNVRFATLDYYSHTSLPIVNLWTAYIRAVFGVSNYENYQLRENNPNGFYIYNYSLSYLGAPNAKDYLSKVKTSASGKKRQ